jgi:hypothetical protein
LDRDGDFRCVERSKLVELLAAHLPVGTIRFGCHIISIKLDAHTSTPILDMHDGSIIKAKVAYLLFSSHLHYLDFYFMGTIHYQSSSIIIIIKKNKNKNK